jgi:hypothetical protein
LAARSREIELRLKIVWEPWMLKLTTLKSGPTPMIPGNPNSSKLIVFRAIEPFSVTGGQEICPPLPARASATWTL